MKQYILATTVICSLICQFAFAGAVRVEAVNKAGERARERATEMMKEATNTAAARTAAIKSVLEKPDGKAILDRLSLRSEDLIKYASNKDKGQEYLEKILKIDEMAVSADATLLPMLKNLANAVGKLSEIGPKDVEGAKLDLILEETKNAKTGEKLSADVINEIATSIAPLLSDKFLDVFLKRTAEENAELNSLFADVASAKKGTQLIALTKALVKIAKAKFPNKSEEEALRELIKQIKDCV